VSFEAFERMDGTERQSMQYYLRQVVSTDIEVRTRGSSASAPCRNGQRATRQLTIGSVPLCRFVTSRTLRLLPANPVHVIAACAAVRIG
jgi:hypothetical protein